MELETILINFSYIGIFVLMTLNGVVNFPSSQILYLLVGFLIATSPLLFVPSLIAGALGNTLGNMISFLLIKKYDKPLAQKLLLMDDATFEKGHSIIKKLFDQKGIWWLFIAKLIPSLKVFVPIIAGLSKIRNLIMFFIFLFTSFIWGGLLISIGYFFGKNVSLTYLPIVSLSIATLIIFILYKKYQKLENK
ncbi:MAG: hypothetical protein RI935_249 [Candidatus Parcubacteria bacterium]|jgi:membrane protein DedA with SNARE-associated domain